MKILKKIIFNVVEYLLVAAILMVVCFFVNKGIVIKGLYMDDLYNWSWFPGCTFANFLKYDVGAVKYRPVFDAVQYIIYMIVGNEPTRFVLINEVLNVFVAVFIYHFIKRIEAGRILSLIFASLYICAHYAYYQIGQAIGNLETLALFLSIVILFFAMKLSGVIIRRNELGEVEKNSLNSNIVSIIIIFIAYFLLIFTHERYIFIAIIILLSIIFACKYENQHKFINYKSISILIFIILTLFIIYIRYRVTRKIIPAGTGGTYVEETFDFVTCLKYCLTQVAIIFGINIGPDYLYGVDFFSLNSSIIKYLILCSIVLALVITGIYVIRRFAYVNKNGRNYLAADVLFLLYIALCIGSTSISIRVEMRFVYASFTVALIYFTYMKSFIFESTKSKIFKIIVFILVVLFAVVRFPAELKYRTYFKYIYCYVDQARMNSLYDNTIGTFGLDDILHNKKIYIVGNTYGMTDFYADYFFRIHDKEGLGNKIIFINDLSEMAPNSNPENSIVLLEDYANYGYKRFTEYG